MPNIKAAEKWVRQSEKRTKRNLDVKTRLKTLFKKAGQSQETAVANGVESQFDKAAQKGIIHPNKAARKKSRLAKRVSTPSVAPIKPAKGHAGAKAGARKAAAKKKAAK